AEDGIRYFHVTGVQTCALPIFTVNVLDYFEGTLSEVVTLALFVPLLIGTGGNTGAQATTVVIRAMSTGDLRFSDLPRVVWREARDRKSVVWEGWRAWGRG